MSSLNSLNKIEKSIRECRLPDTFAGVAFAKKGRYRAYISIGKKQINLGLFDNLDDAKAARKAAEQRYFADRQEKANEIKEKLKKDSSK